MKALRIYVGQDFDAIGWTRDLIRTEVIDGATVTNGVGFWRAPDGEVFDETAQIITFVARDEDERLLLTHRAKLRAAMKREQSIMVELPDGEVQFHEALR